jgi:hypothetical protein
MVNPRMGRPLTFAGLLLVLGCGSTVDDHAAPTSARGDSTVTSNSNRAPAKPYQATGESPAAAVEPQFTSYGEAVRIVRRTLTCDARDVTRSSVVFAAEYCSAGNGEGYMIVNLQGREYIHAGVPKHVWDDFQRAGSMGNYYATNLRGRYRLNLAY